MKICPSCKSNFAGGEVFCPNDGSRLITGSQLDGQAPSSTSGDPLVGTVLAERYKILHQIGEGGMGLVYEAEHVTIEKRVALKVLRDDFSGRPEVVQRFRQEAKSASKIGNEHIVDISDFGTTPSGASYFVMELLTGEDLANVLAREGTIGLERAADIILQCCVALNAAHDKGIVHRDMKPENIFLTDKEGRPDFVKIVDFGIAKMSDIETPGEPGRKLTKTGMIFGTPEYMSPEQAAGRPLDHRVDVYGLAVILFEMLTGRVPFIGDTFMGILTQHMFEDPPAPQEVNPNAVIPESIIGFIYKGLAKEADERYQSCEEMGEALRGALEGRVTGTPTYLGHGNPLTRSSRSARTIGPESADELPLAPAPVSRLGMVALAFAVMFAALVGAGGVWYLGTQDGQPVADGSNTDPSPAPDGGPLFAGPPEIPDSGPAAAPAPEVDAGPAMVTVSVNSSPSGARVFVEDRGEVCESTPCSFETLAGESITVRARRGRSQGETVVAPTENTTLQLGLRRTAPSGGGSRRGGGDTGNDQSGGRGGRGGGGDLKIPDIFRTN